MTYTFYKHVSGKNGYQLVLPTGADFPSETTAAEWVQTAVKEEKEVAKIVKDEIAQRGYRLTKVTVSFTESEGAIPPAQR
ncbi:hypothetical protein [Mesorhizobium sp. CA4]|uniref:hypothetical protein n=1 Tax=Mesorhizobium sp. CA4 TaxID=588499 RepID=UPI001CD15C08|nr:hypothetical protein [Mesorhizobium sp. CA4]MBZ9821915.1 hypothetical protein [Mesorhizobium sp. CA4]